MVENAQGKENILTNLVVKKPVMRGVQLPSNASRALKVRKKKQGAHISKDALEVLREELKFLKELQVSRECSDSSLPKLPDNDDDYHRYGVPV